MIHHTVSRRRHLYTWPMLLQNQTSLRNQQSLKATRNGSITNEAMPKKAIEYWISYRGRRALNLVNGHYPPSYKQENKKHRRRDKYHLFWKIAAQPNLLRRQTISNLHQSSKLEPRLILRFFFQLQVVLQQPMINEIHQIKKDRHLWDSLAIAKKCTKETSKKLACSVARGVNQTLPQHQRKNISPKINLKIYSLPPAL